MKDPRALPPWIDGASSGDPLLSSVLASAASDEPRTEQLEVLGRQLETSLALAPAALALSAAKAKASSAVLTPGIFAKLMGATAPWKIGLGLVAGGLIAGGYHYGLKPSTGAAQPASEVTVRARAGIPASTTSDDAPAIPTVSSPKPSTPPVRAPRRVLALPQSVAAPAPSSSAHAAAEVTPVHSESSPAEDDPGKSPEEEIALVERAQKSLRHGSASEALALSDRHAMQYPNGAVTQESEAIAIEALYRLGRRAEADVRGARFRVRFPASPHLRRIDELAARAASGD